MPGERLSSSREVPYIPFPENPKIIEVAGHQVYEYLSPKIVKNIIEDLSATVRFGDFDEVLVNMKGGMFLFEEMAFIQGWEKSPKLIEYHRKEGGYAADIVIPVPPELKGKSILVVEDIYDSGGVLRQIMEDAGSNCHVVTLVTKMDVPNQIQVPRVTIGVIVDYIWLGGGGMDMGYKDKGEQFRHHPGIVVDIESVKSRLTNQASLVESYHL